MAATAKSSVYSAVNNAGDSVVAIGPDGIDPVAEKLYWFPLAADQTISDYLSAIGYEATRLRPHPTISNIVDGGKVQRLRVGRAQVRPDVNLISAAKAAAAAGCDTNTFRLYARRGHAPKAYDTERRPAWVEPEVVWWATHRKGQGNRTDMTAPTLINDVKKK